jgi:hypothetical protein
LEESAIDQLIWLHSFFGFDFMLQLGTNFVDRCLSFNFS